MTRASHDGHGASLSHAPPPSPPPSADVQHGPWVPTYLSPPAVGFPVFDPSRIGSDHSRVPWIRPSQQRLLRHHSHVALPGRSDLRRAVPEVTCIPVEESIRVRIV
ncbi:hypothetical protein PIB30_048765 [Stylosanthes scabra]|uniref:Uncharacterized protein n=1 Tax=Stylosanthes scabra TaxID=79078 RepID=A0ABU6TGX1_9FABA|nr:hypothetical protein [Stylosanthes scabra]